MGNRGKFPGKTAILRNPAGPPCWLLWHRTRDRSMHSCAAACILVQLRARELPRLLDSGGSGSRRARPFVVLANAPGEQPVLCGSLTKVMLSGVNTISVVSYNNCWSEPVSLCRGSIQLARRIIPLRMPAPSSLSPLKALLKIPSSQAARSTSGTSAPTISQVIPAASSTSIPAAFQITRVFILAAMHRSTLAVMLRGTISV